MEVSPSFLCLFSTIRKSRPWTLYRVIWGTLRARYILPGLRTRFELTIIKEFASYFEAQNQAIATGSITAEPIPIIALGINNGWIDGGIVLRSEIEFGHSNEYRDIITDEQYATYIDALNHECLPALEANCTAISGNNTECLAVFDICYATIYAPIIANADFDSYDIREPLYDPFPPSTYQAYLRDPAVMAAIGTNKSYVEMNETVYLDFVSTGDCKIWPILPNY